MPSSNKLAPFQPHFRKTTLALFLALLCGCNQAETTENTPAQSAIGTVENSGASCSVNELAPYEALADISELPDPFLGLNGERITHQQQWRCRRAEIAAQFQHYELGVKPPKPESVNASIKDNVLTIEVEHEGKHIAFDAPIIYPSTGSAPYPLMIGVGRSSLNQEALDKLGIALVNFPNNDVGEQQNGSSRGKGKFFELYGSDHSASALTAWAWGISRLIDGLAQVPEAKIDNAHIGVTGCSRNGKGAIVAGAFDERIALTIPQESGSGGAASWRVSEAQQVDGQNVQTLKQIVTENVWLTESFKQFSYTVDKVPVDHHELMAMVAPRGLLVIENTSMEWLGNVSAQTTAVVAQHIYQALGAGDNMGASQVGGHNHCQYPDAQLPELNAYLQKFLLGNDSINTQVMHSDGDFKIDLDRWMPWESTYLK
ncbi:hypothetical protein QX776_10290 [Alteromonadaceae bacterium BrNp21-10]|nr:hypothetical protein [Alteromonadaceae bacterium BrNp21-10]